jgi:hypothetical protein
MYTFISSDVQRLKSLKRVRNQGGTMINGGYSAEKGKVKVTLHDGREVIFWRKKCLCVLGTEKRQPTLF